MEVSVATKNWLFTFRRPLFVWEKNELLRLYGIVGSAPSLQLETQDSAVWGAAKPGQSFVSNLYNYGGFESFSRLVWIKLLPPKVQFFGWLAWKHKIKTFVFLQRIGVLPSSASSLCVFCKSQQESLEHVLMLCPFVWRVWSGLLQWWGVSWVIPDSVIGLLQWWSRYPCRKAELRIWRAIPLVTLWSIWKHRNDCSFNVSHPNLQELQELILIRLAFWLKAASKKLHFSISDFLYNISGVRQGLL